jgi:hypothetical protein
LKSNRFLSNAFKPENPYKHIKIKIKEYIGNELALFKHAYDFACSKLTNHMQIATFPILENPICNMEQAIF